jgi:hypothetical protein
LLKSRFHWANYLQCLCAPESFISEFSRECLDPKYAPRAIFFDQQIISRSSDFEEILSQRKPVKSRLCVLLRRNQMIELGFGQIANILKGSHFPLRNNESKTKGSSLAEPANTMLQITNHLSPARSGPAR